MQKSSQILAEFRRSKGLTQQELAEKIGVSRQTIAMWEIDKRLPTDSVAILTARFLSIDEENFLLRLQ
ncbi:MAG: helix-turn-helix transcriptional regulator, partial [Candidatus Poribacteria bacterium]